MINKKWPERPKSLSERGYRKFMAKTKEVTIRGTKYKLQSVSPRWYYDLSDKHLVNGKRNTANYADELIKNVVVSPAEVRTDGIDYFGDEIGTTVDLVEEIESFLKS